MIPWLTQDIAFPPLATALPDPPGLLAAGGDLSPERLLAAYRQGIFPWYAPGEPILWWSPDPRMVLHPAQLKITRSLARTLRNAEYEVRLDSAFDQVIRACATAPRRGQHGTWITTEMQQAYLRLHALGYAHSVETWIDGHLAGGLYGIALGRAFFGESMFSRVRDASKIALAHLCAHLRRRDFGIIDCQMETAHLASLGARPIPRRDFVAALDTLAESGDAPAPWPEGGIHNYFRKSGAAAGPPTGAPAKLVSRGGHGGAAKNMERSEQQSPLSSGVESGFRKATLCADETDEPCRASPTGPGDRLP